MKIANKCFLGLWLGIALIASLSLNYWDKTGQFTGFLTMPPVVLSWLCTVITSFGVSGYLMIAFIFIYYAIFFSPILLSKRSSTVTAIMIIMIMVFHACAYYLGSFFSEAVDIRQ